MKFRTCYNSKSLDLFSKIISTEELEVKLTICVDPLGDTVLEAEGSKEEIRILRELYAMVGGD